MSGQLHINCVKNSDYVNQYLTTIGYCIQLTLKPAIYQKLKFFIVYQQRQPKWNYFTIQKFKYSKQYCRNQITTCKISIYSFWVCTLTLMVMFLSTDLINSWCCGYFSALGHLTMTPVFYLPHQMIYCTVKYICISFEVYGASNHGDNFNESTIIIMIEIKRKRRGLLGKPKWKIQFKESQNVH